MLPDIPHKNEYFATENINNVQKYDICFELVFSFQIDYPQMVYSGSEYWLNSFSGL